MLSPRIPQLWYSGDPPIWYPKSPRSRDGFVGPIPHSSKMQPANLLPASRRILFAALWTAAASAQIATGVVEGRVVDPAGGAVAKAVVRAMAVSTHAVRITQTNSDGFYELPFLALGDYELVVESLQFA